jgi:hypothetical protein
MILVVMSDHRIYLGRKETMLKRNRIIPIVENTQILYLNSNNGEVVQEVWEVILLNRL